MRYGLIGEKLGHSHSKFIHERLAEYIYDLIPLTREEFPSFMKAKDFTAINVTIPYKQEVIPYLNELDPLAQRIGAVNTIVNHSGYLKGYNTDFYGLNYMLKHNGVEIKGKKCLILGNGGTSHTAYAVLHHLGASDIIVVSRQNTEQTVTYEECYHVHTDASVIINTTPLGMYPKIDASPLDLISFCKCEVVVDVIFNPRKTKFTLQAEELGIKGVTGLEMLVAQAKQAAEYFQDKKIDDRLIDDVYQELLRKLY